MGKGYVFQIKDADRRLKKICQKGMIELFGAQPPAAVSERLAMELEIVKNNQHSSYYLLAHMLAMEARRLHHFAFFRGCITASLIAYTSGISDINPLSAEYGGINLPFEITREKYESAKPALDIQCSIAFILFAQSLLARELPEYRCLAYPLAGDLGIRAVRIYLSKDEELPTEEPLDNEEAKLDSYPDFIFFDDYFHVTLIADEAMELARYNKFYRDNVERFDESNSDKMVLKLWRFAKAYDESTIGFKRLKVRTYEELITVLGMAHSTDVWGGLAKKMVLDGSLPLKDMIGSREDLFLYLLKIGFDNEDAYTIMNRVRKGQRLTKELLAEMIRHGAEEWVIDLCMRAKYIFPRAHVAQMIRRDAFCLREPDEFDELPSSDQLVLEKTAPNSSISVGKNCSKRLN